MSEQSPGCISVEIPAELSIGGTDQQSSAFPGFGSTTSGDYLAPASLAFSIREYTISTDADTATSLDFVFGVICRSKSQLQGSRCKLGSFKSKSLLPFHCAWQCFFSPTASQQHTATTNTAFSPFFAVFFSQQQQQQQQHTQQQHTATHSNNNHCFLAAFCSVFLSTTTTTATAHTATAHSNTQQQQAHARLGWTACVEPRLEFEFRRFFSVMSH